MAELRLKQDCITRWNSTYDMLKSFLKSKDAIISTLAITNASVTLCPKKNGAYCR
ncbi:Transposable element Hobo transposase, partial [Dissostichus eleginoides]